MLPRAILFDLDDTILRAYGRPEVAWRAVTDEFSGHLGALTPAEVADVVVAFARDFWSDVDRSRYWRMRLAEARREIVSAAIASLGRTGRRMPPADVAWRLADRFSAYRDEQMCLFPDALDVIDALKAHGVRLGLVTNGAAETQRAKIVRFDLVHRFDHVQIEGEHGFGKPEERAYLHAMEKLGTQPRETWMVGDNLEWEVTAPQRLGIYAIWFDGEGKGLPQDSAIRPDRIVRALSELLPSAPSHQ
jgi:putative hydrolase of the HAD superfamily